MNSGVRHPRIFPKDSLFLESNMEEFAKKRLFPSRTSSRFFEFNSFFSRKEEVVFVTMEAGL